MLERREEFVVAKGNKLHFFELDRVDQSFVIAELEEFDLSFADASDRVLGMVASEDQETLYLLYGQNRRGRRIQGGLMVVDLSPKSVRTVMFASELWQAKVCEKFYVQKDSLIMVDTSSIFQLSLRTKKAKHIAYFSERLESAPHTFLMLEGGSFYLVLTNTNAILVNVVAGTQTNLE